MSNPIPNIVEIIDEPPELNIVSGIPTTGKRPIAILTFITNCQKIMEMIPMETIAPNLSFEFFAIFNAHKMSKR